MSKVLTENNVTVEILEHHVSPSHAVAFYNPVMKINRELVLASLGAYCLDRTGETKCLDAFGATGVTGLQWKKHLKFPVSITINDSDPVCVQTIKENCARNEFTAVQGSDEDLLKTDVGDGENEAPSLECPVEVTQQDANVLMHKRQYNFIHMDPFGSSVQYMDALFRNVFHRGMVVITSTDVAALYGKCPQVTLRNYNAYTVRTDYTKEMAVRILLAQAARSAAKCNKGFDVMYSMAVEHFVVVGLKIKRGANHGNQCMSQLSRYLHCLHCQEWGQLPDTHSPVETPYSHLPCSCKSEQPGQTAVVLGPMWHGEIFNTTFLRQMLQKATEYNLSERALTILTTMITEAECHSHSNIQIVTKETAASDKTETKLDNGEKCKDDSMKKESNEQKDCNTKTSLSDGAVEVDGKSETESDYVNKKSVTSSSDGVENHKNSAEIISSSNHTKGLCGGKRTLMQEEHNESPKAKKLKTVRNYGDNEMPVFYYNLHKRRVKGVDVPKTPKFISRLHKEGYQASRTSFDSQAVRTSACLQELKQVLQEHFNQSNK